MCDREGMLHSPPVIKFESRAEGTASVEGDAAAPVHTLPARPLATARLAVLTVVLLVGLGLRLPTFASRVLSDDEAIYATTADAMARGAVLYRDVVDHKPPAIYDVYLVSRLVLGPYPTQVAHALVILSVLLTAALLWRIAPRLDADGGTDLAAALLFVVFSTAMFRYDSLAANGELFVLLPQAVGLWCLVRHRPAARPWQAYLWSGLATGVAITFKYQGATFLAVIATAAALEMMGGRRGAAQAVARVALAVCGALVVPALYVLRAWHAGGLAALWYWFTFNFAYIRAGRSGLDALAFGVTRLAIVGGIAGFLPYAFGTVGAWQVAGELLGRRRGVPGFSAALEARTLTLAWLASSAIAVGTGGRFFGHYFHHVLPALCLLASGPLVRTWVTRRRLRPVIGALVVVPAVLFLVAAVLPSDAALGDTNPQRPYGVVAARLRALSGTDDRVFVWGNSPQVYALLERPMGTRFSFCNYQTGVSPGTPTETGEADARPNIVWAAWDMLFEDLDRRQPRWIVDAAAAGWDGYGPFPMTQYPRLSAYVRTHYVERERVAGAVLYERTTP